MLRRLNCWPLCVDGGLDQVGQRCRRSLEDNLSGVDSRDVEQIVDQPHHLPNLTFHDRSHAPHRFRRVSGDTNQFQPRANGRQWIAKFMREQR